MLAVQRQALILEEVQRTGTVRVTHLTRLLGVSDMTVRRDLGVLDSRGLLTKVYGGATARRGGSADEPAFTEKAGREQREKDAIAREAAKLVRPGTAIGVSGGSTTYSLARLLADVQDLTVVTNSLRVAEALDARASTNQTVILTGGMRTPSDALVGPIAVQAIQTLHLDQVFLGVYGMDRTAGFTSPNLMESETNRALLAAARSLVVVADHTKWGIVGLSAFAALSAAAVLVTDDGISAAAHADLRETVGNLVVAERSEGPPRWQAANAAARALSS